MPTLLHSLITAARALTVSAAISAAILAVLTASVPAYAQSNNESALQLSPELSISPSVTSPTLTQSGSSAFKPAIKPTLALTQPGAIDVRDDEPAIPTIDLITPPDDLLQRLRNGFSMPDLHSPMVTDRQAWYLNNPMYIKRVIERSRRYLHHIVTELEKRGMPTELALLPIVESSFNPLAYSRARALGMWQFIPSTGKNYRLQQNWWMDQRRDIIASTNAALDYLQNIYEMHGDWHLALASYNWGEGAVARAIAKNRAKGLPTDYLSLNMPLETKYYVPKLQALKNIIAQPEVFGLKLDPIPNRPYFGTVGNPGDMDISLAAKLADIPVDEFIALNPAYQRPVMPGSSNSPLVLPVDKVQTFITNLGSYEAQDKPLSAWQTYTLKPGDKLEDIAAKNGLTTAHLKQLNGINKRTKVGPGFNLLIPGKDAKSNPLLAAKLPSAPPEPAAKTHGGKGDKGHKGSKASGKTSAKSSAHGKASSGKSKGSTKGSTKGSNKPAATQKSSKGKKH